ncbi:hypothetical protein AFK72_09980, partial [Corynebacterium ulcerans]|uniref:hypothetical protein n=1 Tax=Corynebacterium ulcerans TaxID=65058 RepID=UPI0006BB6E09
TPTAPVVKARPHIAAKVTERVVRENLFTNFSFSKYDCEFFTRAELRLRSCKAYRYIRQRITKKRIMGHEIHMR